MKQKDTNFFRASTEYLGDSLIPKKFRRNIKEYYRKAGINDVPYFTMGLAVYFSILIALAVQAFILSLPSFSSIDIVAKIILSIAAIPIMYIVFIMLAYVFAAVYLNLRIQMKVADMEEHFPEFLSSLALNLRITSVLHMALENSAEDEFGILSDEVKRIVRSVRMGHTEEEAIKEFMKKYNSDIMNDSFELILLSWKKGGNTANLVERLYETMKSSNFLKDRVIASVTNYRIFLTMLALIIGPAMFALTYHLIDLIRRISRQVSNIPDNVALPFSINEVRVNDAHFITFAAIAVILIAICISFIMSIVRTGKGSYAYKQMILYAILSFGSFQLFMIIFQIFFALFKV